MSHFGQCGRTRGDLRPRALLVLGLLLGLLGMHALGPSPAMAAPEDRPSVHATRAAGPTGPTVAVVSVVPAASVDSDCADCGHHAAHADPACASGAIGGAYAPPVLAPALDDEAAAASVHAAQGDGPAAGRAPPSLAELQLLRI